MRPLPFAWPYWVVFWLVYAWALFPEARLAGSARKRAFQAGSSDAGSMRGIMIGQTVGLCLAFTLAFLEAARLPANLQPFCFGLGLTMIVCGSLLRRHCRRVLGESFTGDVQVKPGQAVIDRGAYAWVRHPSYSAGALMLLGIGAALGSWASILVVATATFVSYHYRITVEEQALEETLGEPYRAFMRTRKRIIPFIY